jgi:3-phosphoshikimate 1-carboxyvinyltransferase
MIGALRQLGARIDDDNPSWRIVPPPRPTAGGVIDCGLAGTVLRFIPPLAALAPGTTRFTGDDAAAARPVGPLLGALRQLGAEVEGEALPFAVTGPLGPAGTSWASDARGGRASTGFPPATAVAPRSARFARDRGDIVIDASGSSQYVSGLLLAAARFPTGLTLRHEGPALPSRPHIDMTIEALADRGVVVEPLGPSAWRVPAGPIHALSELIEPDLTTAAVFLAAALIARGQVTIPGWPTTSSQPGAAVPDLLTRFGGSTCIGPQGLTMTGDGFLRGVDIDLGATSELTPVVAALATLAEGRTVIRGVSHIRGHETDRLAALTREITALGGHCAETRDGLVIEPTRLRGGLWHTCQDHRLAHAGALIGLRVPDVELDDVGVVSKTMPGFVDAWWEMIG